MTNAVVLMTALVPTIGHVALIEFAKNLVGSEGYVDVIVSTRSFETVPGKLRIDSLRKHFLNRSIFRVSFWEHADDNAPQTPSTPEEWEYWKSVVYRCTDGFGKDATYLVASEPYGKKMAEIIGAEFIPFDIERDFVNVKGTVVREDYQFNNMVPEFTKHFVQRVTFFGQESCGKTTMTKEIHNLDKNASYMIHEFARPYIEFKDDKSINSHIMETVARGQFALQKTAYEKTDRPIILQDTDLLSTIGYYRIYNEKFGPLKCSLNLNEMFNQTKSHLYIVMNDEIPFEEDDLRYGGKERESTKQFWIDLLEEYKCNYYVVKNTTVEGQTWEIQEVINNLFRKVWSPIENFKRD